MKKSSTLIKTLKLFAMILLPILYFVIPVAFPPPNNNAMTDGGYMATKTSAGIYYEQLWGGKFIIIIAVALIAYLIYKIFNRK